MSMKHCWNKWQEKPAPLALCSSQIPHALYLTWITAILIRTVSSIIQTKTDAVKSVQTLISLASHILLMDWRSSNTDCTKIFSGNQLCQCWTKNQRFTEFHRTPSSRSMTLTQGVLWNIGSQFNSDRADCPRIF
jgi:hypothetical protein